MRSNALTACALLAVLAARPMEGGAQRADIDFSKLDSLLESAAAGAAGASGGFTLVLMRSGETIYSRSFGDFSPSRVVPIASASKWLAGAVVMSLVDDGRLALDDTLGRWFPGLAAPQSRITVRQLFSHTSGLPAQSPCLARAGGSLATCAEEILRVRPRTMPGRRFEYGGASMQVAGRVAELAGGASWNELFARRVVAPLGLRHTSFGGAVRPHPRIAGGALASAEEFATFLAMIAAGGMHDGRRILSADAIREMLADQTRSAAIGSSPYSVFRAVDPRLARSRYGVGVWRETFTSGEEEVVEHASPGALGFVPWYDPARDIVGVFAARSTLGAVMPTVLEARRLVREAVDAAR